MIRVYHAVVHWLFHLEIYEIAGLFMSAGVSFVFFRYDTRLNQVFGYIGFPFRSLDNLYAVALQPSTWEFIVLLILFSTVFLGFRKSRSVKYQRFSYFARIALSFLILMTIYKVIIFYINVFNPFDRDFTIMHLDKVLFLGKLPSQWIAPLVNPVFNYLFSAAYMSWFVLVYATVVILYKSSFAAVRDYMTTAIVTFYIGYIVYFFVPAIGPVFMIHYHTSVGPLPKLLILGQHTIARDCFPSLHTGISIVMAANIWRYRRRWSWLYIPLVSLIIASTLYLRVHYFLDVAAGTALAVITTQLSSYAVTYWERLRAKVLHANELNSVSGLALGPSWPDLARDGQ